MDPQLITDLRTRADALGFSQFGVTKIQKDWPAKQRLHQFIKSGFHGDMQWMAEHAARREHPNAMWDEARSAIVLGFDYGPDHNPLEDLSQTSKANISVYARGSDYHDLIKKRLKQLASILHQQTKQNVKVFVDTAPLMEKPLAQMAGIGWQGKHTNLVSRQSGSWFFLGVILSAAELPNEPTHADHCGSCQDCLDICPTNAFVAPYQLDARSCISYLTIEHQGHIDQKFRSAMGNRIYGCDDCLAVCPWNKYAQSGKEAKLYARPELTLPSLADLAKLDDASFREVFAGSPIKRTGRDRILRNVLIAIGNSKNSNLIPAAKSNLGDPSPLVRAMAIWALSQLLPTAEFEQLAALHRPNEPDIEVQNEWQVSKT